jgi:hypothetical protein
MLPIAATCGECRSLRKPLLALLTVSTLGGTVALQWAFPFQGERCVVIHSDDAGMYSSVNQATNGARDCFLV